jgi:hypothetical protein
VFSAGEARITKHCSSPIEGAFMLFTPAAMMRHSDPSPNAVTVKSRKWAPCDIRQIKSDQAKVVRRLPLVKRPPLARDLINLPMRSRKPQPCQAAEAVPDLEQVPTREILQDALCERAEQPKSSAESDQPLNLHEGVHTQPTTGGLDFETAVSAVEDASAADHTHVRSAPAPEHADCEQVKVQSKKKRTTPPAPPMEEIMAAAVLPVRLAEKRYKGMPFRHLIYQAERERRNPRNGVSPQGFAKCVIRPADSKRKVLINCIELDAYLQGNANSLKRAF